MIDKHKIYEMQELLDKYVLYNLEFRKLGDNANGELELLLKTETDTDKVSVFKSMNHTSKHDYLKLSEEQARKMYFKFDREENIVDLDIVAIVVRTSDINIPAGRYTLKTLDELTKAQDLEERPKSDFEDGIVYLIVENSVGCNLYDGVYTFSKENCGLLDDLEKKYEKETDELLKNNLKLILDYQKNCEELLM